MDEWLQSPASFWAEDAFLDQRPQQAVGFCPKGGKSREIPVRHDLEGFISAYVETAGIAGDAKDTPLFQASNEQNRRQFDLLPQS